MFTEEGGTWRSIGPKIGSPTAAVKVLALRRTGDQLIAAFFLTTGSRARVVGGTDAAGAWRRSSLLAPGTHGCARSLGPSPDGKAFVLSGSTRSTERLAVAGSRGLSWTSTPDPPRGTATVACSATGRVGALAVDDTVMTGGMLVPGGAAWSRHHSVRVAIGFSCST